MPNNGDEILATVDEGLSGVRQGESDSPQVQDAGRPNFIFPPPEVKFDGGNMFEWSKMVTLTLYGCQLGDHLTDDPRAASDPEYKKWRAEESLILSWMLRSMTPEMRRDFLYCDTVKEMWDDIQKYSEEQSHDWRIYELNVQATQARQGTDNVLQYSSKLKAVWREIDYLWPTHNPQSVERQYILKQRLFTFLMGLNPTYESVRSQLLHREKLPSLEELLEQSDRQRVDCVLPLILRLKIPLHFYQGSQRLKRLQIRAGPLVHRHLTRLLHQKGKTVVMHCSAPTAKGVDILKRIVGS
ncbi:uncharacterized protein LOC144711354 [Wolffia australiana]